MARRLDELVASAFTGELEIDVQRITPVNGSGKSQFRGIVNYANGSGIAHEGVLDLLVNEEEADISFNTLYVTTVPVSGDLGTNDSFPITYVSIDTQTESTEGMPIRILSIGSLDGRIERKTKEINEEKAAVCYPPVIPLANKNGIVYLTRLPHVAVVDKRGLVNNRFTPSQARNAIWEASKKGFASYIMNDKKFVLVPHGLHERFHRDLSVDAFDYSGIDLIPKTGLQEYINNRNVSLEPYAQISEILLGDGNTYYARTAVDSFIVSRKTVKTAKEKAPAHPKNEKVQYKTETRSENGIEILVMKDVAKLDGTKLWKKAKINSQRYARMVLRRETERHGFAEYRASNNHGGCPRRIGIIPRGSEERIYKGLTLDTFADLELIREENIEAYMGQYSIKYKAEEQKIGKSPLVTFADGTTYHLKESIDTIIKKAEVDITKKKITKKKKENKNKSPKKRDPVDNVINVHDYNPLGTISDRTYMYDGRSVTVLDEGEKLVKYGEIFNSFTPTDITGAVRGRYQIPMRNCILKTTAARDRRDEEGNLVPETEVGRGKKHYLETRVANLCMMYLVDHGFTRPAKVE